MDALESPSQTKTIQFIANHSFANFIEYYDGFGKLHSLPIDDEKGIIKRSVTKSSTNATIPDYSSLIVDLIKP